MPNLFEIIYLNGCKVSFHDTYLQEKLLALSNVLFKLSQHPSQAGPLHACRVIENNVHYFTLFERKTLDFLLGALETAILRDPTYISGHKRITQEYFDMIMALIPHRGECAYHFLHFFQRLCRFLITKPGLDMGNEVIQMLDQALICSILYQNYPLYLEILNLLNEFMTKKRFD